MSHPQQCTVLNMMAFAQPGRQRHPARFSIVPVLCHGQWPKSAVLTFSSASCSGRKVTKTVQKRPSSCIADGKIPACGVEGDVVNVSQWCAARGPVAVYRERSEMNQPERVLFVARGHSHEFRVSKSFRGGWIEAKRRSRSDQITYRLYRLNRFLGRNRRAIGCRSDGGGAGTTISALGTLKVSSSVHVDDSAVGSHCPVTASSAGNNASRAKEAKILFDQ